MRISAGAIALWFAAGCLALAQPAEKLTYGIEWRLIHAGAAYVESRPGQITLRLESAGIVSSLFKIQDVYTVNFDQPLCATSSVLDAREGKRHNENRVTYDRAQNHAFFIERDLLKNSVVRETGTDIPNCVADVLGGLAKLRTMDVEPGQSVRLAISDGRRSANVKIDAQEHEEVKTPAGTYQTTRYEVGLLNGVVYTRKGRVFVWFTNDARRLPVRIRVRMNFPVGTVTLDLEKQEGL